MGSTPKSGDSRKVANGSASEYTKNLALPQVGEAPPVRKDWVIGVRGEDAIVALESARPMSERSMSEPSVSQNSPLQNTHPASTRPEGSPTRFSLSKRSVVFQQLSRQLKKTSEKYRLLAPKDKIMVAVSGGKDSYGLLLLLADLKARLPFPIELVAVHLDQAQPGYDGAPLRNYLANFGVPYEILREDTYSVVMDHVQEGGTYCSLCSRLRRGILYRAAERLGCNKIALGHHRDDALETFLMNLLYSGKMQSMPPIYKTDDGRFEVIRPLIECEEERLVSLAVEEAFPILPCNLCGSQEGLSREKMGELLGRLAAEIPNVKSVMMAALGNVCPTHLLDQDVARAWEERDSSIPAKASLGRGQLHTAGGARRLPLVP